MSDTASFAREAIAAADNAPAETPSAGGNAADYPDLAVQEMDHLAAADADNPTRRIAAAVTTFHDQRPFVSTAQGMPRRQFNDGDGIGGTRDTRRIAREMIDMAAWAEGRKADPRDRRSLAIHDFAASVNKSTTTGTLDSRGAVLTPGSDAWHEKAEDVLGEIMAMGRNAK